MALDKIKNKLKDASIEILNNSIVEPGKKVITDNISTTVTTIGTFVARKISDKFVQSISFDTERYYDYWMEDALFGILEKFNDFKKLSHVNFKSNSGVSEIRYALDDGLHQLKYRKWNIHLNISSTSKSAMTYNQPTIRSYTLYAFTNDENFIKYFEADMRSHYFDFSKANTVPGKINMFVSETHSQGKHFSHWTKMPPINERKLSSIYIDIEDKERIINTINEFFKNKKLYRENGIPHNLKIMLYGQPGCGKDSIARMIATEWKRNIYYINPERSGEMIPEAISDTELASPLIIISDIDNYPEIINHISLDGKKENDELSPNTTTFAKMLNALDGMMCGEDKIVLMTTNHIEKIDESFLRAGRIDLLMEIKPVSVYVFRKYIKDKYGVILPKDIELIRDNIKVSELQADLIFTKLPLNDICKKYLKEGTY